MRTGRRNNNKGFSMVELLVVIAIMALMVGMFLLSSNILNLRAGRQCAKQIKQELDQARIATMGKNSVSLNLYTDSVGRIWMDEITEAPKIGETGTHTYTEKKQVGSKRAVVQILPKGGTAVDLNDTGVYFEYNRSTGAFKNVTGGQIAGNYFIDEIYVTGGGQKHTLKLKKVSGKVEEID